MTSARALKSMIARKGEDVDIYRKSSGAVDAYGDAAPTWTKQATEKMLVVPLTSQSTILRNLRVDVAGKYENVEQIAYAKSDSVIAKNDRLDVGALQWTVLYVEPFRIQGSARINICFLEVYQSS